MCLSEFFKARVLYSLLPSISNSRDKTLMAKYSCVLLMLMTSVLFGLHFSGVYGQGSCRPSDIQIYQNPLGFGAGNVPRYTVRIINESPESMTLRDVHVNCGDFASTTLINPAVFRRLKPGDCLVKDGQPLEPYDIIVFDYTNLLPYRLKPSIVRCA